MTVLWGRVPLRVPLVNDLCVEQMKLFVGVAAAAGVVLYISWRRRCRMAVPSHPPVKFGILGCANIAVKFCESVREADGAVTVTQHFFVTLSAYHSTMRPLSLSSLLLDPQPAPLP